MADNKKIRVRLNELRGMADAALGAAIAAAQKNVYQFHKDRLSKPQENVKVIRNSRKEIARALTIRRERELAAQAGQG